MNHLMKYIMRYKKRNMNQDKIFEILENSIKNDRKIKKNSNILVITEEDSGAKCKAVKIKTNSKTFCLMLDKKNEKVTNILRPKAKGINKINDACLFFICKDKLYAVLIELKSNDASGHLEQIASGKNFVKYLFEQLKLFNSRKFGNVNIGYIAILFRLSSKKGTTKKINPVKFEKNKKYNFLHAILTCNQIYNLQQIKEALEKLD